MSNLEHNRVRRAGQRDHVLAEFRLFQILGGGIALGEEIHEILQGCAPKVRDKDLPFSARLLELMGKVDLIAAHTRQTVLNLEARSA